MKDNILFHRLTDQLIAAVGYFKLHDTINDLTDLMLKYNLTYDAVEYHLIIRNYNHFRIEFNATDINAMHYDNGIVRLYSGTANCRYLNNDGIPSLLFALRLIDRMWSPMENHNFEI